MQLPIVKLTIQVFQELEEDRVRFIRFHMWHWCNIGCQVAVDEDGVRNIKKYSDKKCT